MTALTDRAVMVCNSEWLRSGTGGDHAGNRRVIPGA